MYEEIGHFLERLVKMSAHLEPVGDLDGVLRHRLHAQSGTYFHEQIFLAGRLHAWRLVDPTSARRAAGPVLVQHGGWALYCPAEGDPRCSFLETSHLGTTTHLPLPPFDDREQQQPFAPGADLTLRVQFTGSPIGTIGAEFEFRDGVCISLLPISPQDVFSDRCAARTVEVGLPWRAFTADRAADMESKDLLSRCTRFQWDGAWSTLSLTAGILGSRLALSRVASLVKIDPLLAGYGELVTSKEWQRLFRELAHTVSLEIDEPCCLGVDNPIELGLARTEQDFPHEEVKAVVWGSQREAPVSIGIGLPGVEDLLAPIVADCSDRIHFTGMQIAAFRDGRQVLDVAVGQTIFGDPYRTDTMSAVYCAAKPAIVSGVLVLLEQGDLNLTDTIGSVLPGLQGRIADCDILDLLGHTAGLYQVNRMRWGVIDRSDRYRLLSGLQREVGRENGARAVFADAALWCLYAWIIESVSGQPFSDFIEERVLRPWGVSDTEVVLQMDEHKLRVNEGRLSVNLDSRSSPPTPLLSEISPLFVSDYDAGAYATASGLGKIWKGLEGDALGAGLVLGQEIALRMLKAAAPPAYDPILRRKLAFAFAGFTPPAPGLEGWLGQAAEGAMAFGAVHTDSRTIIAFTCNGSSDFESGFLLRASQIPRRIFSCLEAQA